VVTTNALSSKTKENQEALNHYCATLDWNVTRLRTALHSTGLSNEQLYLAAPNEAIIDFLAEFLTITSSSLLTIIGSNGYGKSALKEFSLRALVDDPRFLAFSVDNPGSLKPYQLVASIFHNINPDLKCPRSTGSLLGALERELVELRCGGRTTLIWVDEGQKLKIEQVGMLRAISDIKTSDGELVCKIVIIGTQDLQKHLIEWLERYPEEAGAFDDRCGFYTITLNPWSENHINEWVTQLHKYAAQSKKSRNPFDSSSISMIHAISEGKPRSIVQLAQMALNYKAKRYFHNSDEALLISAEDIQSIINKRG
jgi:type II secretory pathway predicted ATPase ExeA